MSDGISVLRTAEGGLAEISNITIRLRELTVQAGNGTLDDQGRAAIQAEFDALTSEITRISEATEFGSHKLLNGDTSGAAAITIRDGTGSEGVVQISIGDSSAESLGLAGRDASDPATLDAIDEALNSVSTTRGDIGATENRLRSGIRNLQETQVNTASARSRIADADFAKVASDRARSQILERVAIATQVQANISAGSALGLLKP